MPYANSQRGHCYREGTMPSPNKLTSHLYLRSALIEKIYHRTSLKPHAMLIEAQAGQGKSTFARQYVEKTALKYVWVSLSQEDTDLSLLVTTFYHAIKQSLRKFRSAALASMIKHGEVTGVKGGKYATLLIRDLKRAHKKNLTIVVDDIYLVEESMGAVSFLSRLAEETGKQIQLVLISRPRIHRSIRAHFQSLPCIYLSSLDLAFTKAETREFVHDVMDLPLSLKQIGELHGGSQGWVMGILSQCHRLKECLENHEPLPSLRAYPTDTFPCFLSETLSYRKHAAFPYLLLLANLDSIPEALAVDVTGRDDVINLLTSMWNNNVFLVRQEIPPASFHLHHAFRDFLRRVCRQSNDQKTIDEFLVRCGDWYKAHGRYEKSLTCYIEAKNYDVIEILMKEHGLALFHSGRHQHLFMNLSQIPEAVFATKGWTAFFMGVLSLGIMPLKGLALFERSQAIFARQGSPLGQLLASAEYAYAHIHIGGDITKALPIFKPVPTLFSELKASLPPYFQARVANLISSCCFYYLGDIETSRASLETARQTAHSKNLHNALLESLGLANLLFLGRGEIEAATRACDDIIKKVSHPRTYEHNHNACLLFLLNTLAFNGDFKSYRHHKSLVTQDILENQYMNTVFDGFLTVWDATILLAEGEPDHARRHLSEALKSGREKYTLNIMAQLLEILGYTHALLGDRDEALRVAEKARRLRADVNTPYFDTVHHLFLGAMYVQLRMHDEADQALFRSMEISRTMEDRFIPCACLAHLALNAIRQKDDASAHHHTAAWMGLMSRQKYTHFYSWSPEVTLPLLTYAVQSNIHPEKAQELARNRLHLAIEKDGRAIPLLQVKTLGGFSLTYGKAMDIEPNVFTATELKLLYAVFAAPNCTAGTHEICDYLWPEASEDNAEKTLKVNLTRIKKKIARKGTVPQHYLVHKNKRVSLLHCRIDTQDFNHLANKGLAHLDKGETWQAANAFRSALRLWDKPVFNVISHDLPDGFSTERKLALLLQKVCYAWTSIIKAYPLFPQRDLDLIENVLSWGGATAGVIQNLMDIYSERHDTLKIKQTIALYRSLLKNEKWSQEEIETELDGLCEQTKHA